MIESIRDKVTLPNGHEMPGFGFGTYKSVDGNDAEESVFTAIGAGYRHIDCASFYQNEEGVGRGIQAGMAEYGLEREDLFITSKVWTSDRAYDNVLASCDESMHALGVRYLDLLLIHWPADEHSDPDWINTNHETWRAFTDLYKAGTVKAIGVSNFWPEHLRPLLDEEVPPMVNQLEYHPGYLQNGDSEKGYSGYCEEDVVRFSKDNGMVVEAWSPLGRAKVLEDETLMMISEKYGKSPAQICLRWAIQNDIVPLPKSVHEKRIYENANVFDFELDGYDMSKIEEMELAGFSGHTPKDVPW